MCPIAPIALCIFIYIKKEINKYINSSDYIRFCQQIFSIDYNIYSIVINEFNKLTNNNYLNYSCSKFILIYTYLPGWYFRDNYSFIYGCSIIEKFKKYKYIN